MIRNVIEIASDENAPRQLLNSAWSFERKNFDKYCESTRADTQANTNIRREYLLNLIAFGGNGQNIRAVQGLLQNQRRRSFNVFIGKLVPCVLSRKSLKCVSNILTDDDRQLQGGFQYARSVGVLNRQSVSSL
jgi:hypothetical protein